MELITSPQHVPTFIHIPKNAGTYVLSWFHLFNKLYSIKLQKNQSSDWSDSNIRRHIVELKNNKQLTCCVYVNNYNINATEIDSNTDSIALEDFVSALHNEDLDLFSISINPIGTGMSESFEAVDLICSAINISPCYFTIFREPFSRAKSLFEYLTSPNSSHESTHDLYKLKDFNNYITSYYVEDSFIIRHILSLSNLVSIEPMDVILNENHFLRCSEVLERVRVFDIDNTDSAINEIMGICYGLQQCDIKQHFGSDLNSFINFNHTKYKNDYKFSYLNKSQQNSFLSRTYWDRKIYERFVMRDKFPGFYVS